MAGGPLSISAQPSVLNSMQRTYSSFNYQCPSFKTRRSLLSLTTQSLSLRRERKRETISFSSISVPAETMSSAEPKNGRNFPSIAKCSSTTTTSYDSIAADLDGTLLISRSSFPYFMLVAIEAGSLLRGFVLLLSLPVVIVSYLFISEAIGIQILIFISFSGLKIRDIELVSRAVLPRYSPKTLTVTLYDIYRFSELYMYIFWEIGFMRLM